MVFPLRPLAALVPMSLLFHSHEDDVPPPYSETSGDRRPSSFPNTHTSASFHPADPAADMEWRKYPNLPSAYPPTPLVNSSRLPNPQSVSGHVGTDPSAAVSYEIWVPPVVEEDEEEQEDPNTTRIVPMELRTGQSFSRSLLPHRVPLHPGLGNHDGLSDESDRGVEYKAQMLAGIRRNFSQSSSSAEEAKGMEVDTEDNRRYESDDDDEAELDSDDDSFNVTLQTPRVPLSLQPSSATASRSTIRMRASARSVFTELERETDGKRHSTGSALLPFLDTTSIPVISRGKSSPSSIDSESLSISSGDQMSMLQSKSRAHPGLSQVPGPLLIPSGTDNDDITSDSSLGSAPGIDTTSRFSTPNARGRKRSHSRSFPQKEKEKGPAGPSLQHLSSVESISSSSSHAPSDEDEDVPVVASTSTSKNIPAAAVKRAHSLRSAGRAIEETSGAAEPDEGEVRAQEVLLTGTRKRRKVISSSSASNQGGTSTTSESEPAPTGSRVSSRRKPLSIEKGKEKALVLPNSRTTRASRTRKHLSVSAEEEIYDRPSAKGKGKAPATTTKSLAPSAPTRKRSDTQALKSAQSTTSLKTPSLAKSSSSTLRMTRSTTTNTDSFDIDERSDVGSGLEADDFPLHVARERVKKRI